MQVLITTMILKGIYRKLNLRHIMRCSNFKGLSKTYNYLYKCRYFPGHILLTKDSCLKHEKEECMFKYFTSIETKQI
jgi:hypothetical protein